MSHTMGWAKRWFQDGQRTIKNGDIITAHFEMDKKTLGFSINEEYLGELFDDIEDGNYRFAVCMVGTWNKTFQFIE